MASKRKSAPNVKHVNVKFADMKPEMKDSAIEMAQSAMVQHEQEKDIAGFIKKEMDKKFSGTWHCFVGRHFGTWVTHDEGAYLYAYVGNHAILLFRSV